MADYSRILVTGGLGFIGSHLTEFLAAQYPAAKLLVVDKHNYASNIRNLRSISHKERFRIECFDLARVDRVRETIRNFCPDIIFHLAAENHVAHSNALGTHNLLEVARQHGSVKLFVYISTDEVYAAETQVVSHAQGSNLPAVIIRCSGVYGPRQFCEKVVPRFVLQALRGTKCTIHGTGEQRRSFLHVSDAVKAIHTIVQNHRPEPTRVKAEIINIGSTREITINELAFMIFNAGEEADMSSFSKEEVELRSGLLETKAWYREHAAEWFVPEDIDRAIHSDGHFHEREGEERRETHIMLVGGTGWIGPKITAVLAGMGARVSFARFRLQDTRAMWEEIKAVNPSHVVLCAGITGRPNIDWCETHPQETVSVNLEGTVMLAQVCNRLGIHLTNYTTGCIYAGTEDTDPFDIVPFTELDMPNFTGSLYSRTKAHAENIQMGAYASTTLVLRLRMPIGDDIDHPRNLVAKLRNYSLLINILNSVSVLPELLPISCHMTIHSHTGLYNFVNPGVITPAWIMTMFDSAFPHLAQPWTAVDNTDILLSSKAIVAPRSNCVLSPDRLMRYVKEHGLNPPLRAFDAIARTLLNEKRRNQK